MPSRSTLSLGTRKDAKYWSTECGTQLSYSSGVTITKPNPTTQEIASFFARSDEWLFLGGHFDETSHLYNEDGTVSIRFTSDSVIVKSPSSTKTLSKNQEFMQHKKIRTIFWGGCNVHSHPTIVKKLRTLFDNPLMIGWKSITGWQILYTVMGGNGNLNPNPEQDFFDLVKANPGNEDTVRKSWLNAGAQTFWGDSIPKFSVIDSIGTDHTLPD